MIRITADISSASSGLAKMIAGLSDMSPLLEECGAYMERETKLNIAKGQTYQGAAFAPLAASTLRQKRSGRILQETGAMVSSVSSRVSGNEARVGPSVRHAIYHQFGTSKMPARPFVGVADRHHPKLQKIAQDYVRRIAS